jgi:hypothetical protein
MPDIPRRDAGSMRYIFHRKADLKAPGFVAPRTPRTDESNDFAAISVDHVAKISAASIKAIAALIEVFEMKLHRFVR